MPQKAIDRTYSAMIAHILIGMTQFVRLRMFSGQLSERFCTNYSKNDRSDWAYRKIRVANFIGVLNSELIFFIHNYVNAKQCIPQIFGLV